VKKTLLFAVAACLLMAAWALAEDTGTATKVAASTTNTAVANVSAYPLDKCIISGEKLGEGGKAVTKVYDGREVKFCCGGCVKTFEKDQAKWMKKLDDAIVSAESKSYPLETCVVSGEKLGGMGEPVNYMYKNQLVKLCCKNCIAAFEKEPDKYLAKLSAATSPSTPAKPEAK
jgi:hypothetical protein